MSCLFFRALLLMVASCVAFSPSSAASQASSPALKESELIEQLRTQRFLLAAQKSRLSQQMSEQESICVYMEESLSAACRQVGELVCKRQHLEEEIAKLNAGLKEHYQLIEQLHHSETQNNTLLQAFHLQNRQTTEAYNALPEEEEIHALLAEGSTSSAELSETSQRLNRAKLAALRQRICPSRGGSFKGLRHLSSTLVQSSVGLALSGLAWLGALNPPT